MSKRERKGKYSGLPVGRGWSWESDAGLPLGSRAPVASAFWGPPYPEAGIRSQSWEWNLELKLPEQVQITKLLEEKNTRPTLQPGPFRKA